MYLTYKSTHKWYSKELRTQLHNKPILTHSERPIGYVTREEAELLGIDVSYKEIGGYLPTNERHTYIALFDCSDEKMWRKKQMTSVPNELLATDKKWTTHQIVAWLVEKDGKWIPLFYKNESRNKRSDAYEKKRRIKQAYKSLEKYIEGITEELLWLFGENTIQIKKEPLNILDIPPSDRLHELHKWKVEKWGKQKEHMDLYAEKCTINEFITSLEKGNEVACIAEEEEMVTVFSSTARFLRKKIRSMPIPFGEREEIIIADELLQEEQKKRRWEKEEKQRHVQEEIKKRKEKASFNEHMFQRWIEEQGETFSFISVKDVSYVLEKRGKECTFCKRTLTPNWTCLTFYFGQLAHKTNVRLCCRSCFLMKGNETKEEFLARYEEKRGLYEALKRNNTHLTNGQWKRTLKNFKKKHGEHWSFYE